MSRDPYRSSAGDLGHAGTRWDAEQYVVERDRDRYDAERDRFEERDFRIIHTGAPRAPSRHREISVNEVHDRRTSRGFEEDRFRERVYFDEPEEPRLARELPVRSITIEKERERERERERYYSPSPPRRAPPRPGLIRRQSSLDTFDRKPLRFYEREEYGPPALRDDYRPAVAPITRIRALPPPQRYVEREREYEDVKIREPGYYEEDYRSYLDRVVPERIREREIIRTRRRSRSEESRTRSSSSSSSSSAPTESTRSEFPKKGKTRIPGKLVSVRAVIELGYPYEVEGETIVIRKALGREHIDEVIKLSQTYKSLEKVEMSGGRSNAGDIYEETSREIIVLEPPRYEPREEVVEKLTVERREVSPARSHISRSRSVGRAPLIVDTQHTEYIERSNDIPIGPMVLMQSNHRHSDHRRHHKKANKEIQIIKREERDDGSVILYKREEIREPETVLRIEKNKKGRLSISVPKGYR